MNSISVNSSRSRIKPKVGQIWRNRFKHPDNALPIGGRDIKITGVSKATEMYYPTDSMVVVAYEVVSDIRGLRFLGKTGSVRVWDRKPMEFAWTLVSEPASEPEPADIAAPGTPDELKERTMERYGLKDGEPEPDNLIIFDGRKRWGGDRDPR